MCKFSTWYVQMVSFSNRVFLCDLNTFLENCRKLYYLTLKAPVAFGYVYSARSFWFLTEQSPRITWTSSPSSILSFHLISFSNVFQSSEQKIILGKQDCRSQSLFFLQLLLSLYVFIILWSENIACFSSTPPTVI